MRADRLISLLLLLQRKGHVTAHQVARELEVSPRTARRDLEALAMSGVPVYSQTGRNGGWFLLGGATTDLTGLNEPEARALVLAASAALGDDPKLQAGLRKLVSALPEPFRAAAEVARESIISDRHGWGGVSGPADHNRPECFDTVSRALLDSRRLTIGYVSGGGKTSKRTISPLGIIEKRLRWYLLAGTAQGELRTFRMDRITSSTILDTQVERPEGFDLFDAWTDINARFTRHALTVAVEGTADSPATVDQLRRIIGPRLQVGPPSPSGDIPVTIRSWSEEAAARELAAFGSMVRVVSPPGVIRLLGQIGRALVSSYSADHPSPTPTGLVSP